MSDEKKKIEGIEVVELGDLGYDLPIGLPSKNGIKRDYSLKPLVGEQEIEIGRWKGENEGAPVTSVVSKVLSVMLDSLAGEPFESGVGKSQVEEEKALQKIGRLYVPDVWTMYVRARVNEFGPEYAIPFQCPIPTCEYHNKEVKIKADLNRMDIHVVRDHKLLQQKVPLRRGMKYRDGSVKKVVTVTPMLWANMTTPEALRVFTNETLFKMHHVQKCITGVEGVDHAVVLSKQEMAQMSKIDIETVYRAINEVNLGPKMIAEGECKCGFSFGLPLNWEYEHFFSTSSLC